MIATRATDPTIPITVLWPIRGDNTIALWLVPGDWTRGRATAYVAHEEGVPFVHVRARRVFMRWAHHIFDVPGWRFDDGTLTGCVRSDPDAERYWEVTV